MNQKELRKQDALVWLHSRIKTGDTIYTSLKHVSRSGMFRVISVLIAINKEVIDISGPVCAALGDNYNEKQSF